MTKGRYIPMIQREAVFASMMLPEDERNELRARHAMATEVLNRFELHHIQYFAWGAENAWWNLHPMPKAEHRERTRRDIATIAKSKRIVKKEHAFAEALLKKLTVTGLKRFIAKEERKVASARVGNLKLIFEDHPNLSTEIVGKKIPSRPFPKTKRKIAQRKRGA